MSEGGIDGNERVVLKLPKPGEGCAVGLFEVRPPGASDLRNRQHAHPSGERLQQLLIARGEGDFLFLMNATPVSQVRAVAEEGEVMPQKATYFYPKVLTGLAIHTLDPDGDVPDPSGSSQEVYTRTARRLQDLIRKRLAELGP